MNDNILNKIEEKTNVDKETIISFARRLQSGNYKDESTLRDIIHELSIITGKEVSEERENKIVEMIINDKVPKDIEKYV